MATYIFLILIIVVELMCSFVTSSSNFTHLLRAETMFPRPFDRLSYTNFSGLAQGLTSTERESMHGCSFVSLNPKISIECPIERDEHDLVRKFISPKDSVLELGGRFGTTSCEIAVMQNNSGSLIVVEPDKSAWSSLLHNRKNHNCNFILFRGVIGDSPVEVLENSYGTRAIRTNNNKATTDANGRQSSRMALAFQEIQSITSLRFSVLLIDCEGCIEYIFSEQEKLHLNTTLANVRVILLEKDMPVGAPDCQVDCVDYAVWKQRFLDAGFAEVVNFQDRAFPFIYHTAYARNA